MPTFWVGIAGQPTPDQLERLGAAGLVEKGVTGDAFSRTIYRTYFLAKAASLDAAVDKVGAAVPELRDKWEASPPHVIRLSEKN